MKKHVPLLLMNNRVRSGQMASDDSYGMAGMFRLIGPRVAPSLTGKLLIAMSSGVDSEHRWEHVSVVAENRCPTWEEMCFVKDVFWDEEECAMQLHPPKSVAVNFHPHCLHLWRPMDMPIPVPPTILVGPR